MAILLDAYGKLLVEKVPGDESVKVDYCAFMDSKEIAKGPMRCPRVDPIHGPRPSRRNSIRSQDSLRDYKVSKFSCLLRMGRGCCVSLIRNNVQEQEEERCKKYKVEEKAHGSALVTRCVPQLSVGFTNSVCRINDLVK